MSQSDNLFLVEMNYMGFCVIFLQTTFIISFCSMTLASESNLFNNVTRKNLAKCKLTHLGTEYAGFIATTAGGIRCQMWYSGRAFHQVSEEITAEEFPERSMRLAKNFCRNPTRNAEGPWCYTMEATLTDDVCEIPLCNFGECRLSGPGSEYGGTRGTSTSGKKCKSWDKHLKLPDGKTERFSGSRFSDLSRSTAKNYCRNPDGSIGGPWCYVAIPDSDVVEKEYCTVPFCDDKDYLVYTKNSSVYSTITNLKGTIANISFWIKLWDPNDQQSGEARLLFSNLQVPTSAEIIAQDWRAGVEIVISNSGSGQAYPNQDENSFEDTPNILLGSRWTGLWIAWGNGFISVGRQGTMDPIFLDEYKKRNTISSLYPDGFQFYGIIGTGVLWSMPLHDESCAHHTTYGTDFLRVWPLEETESTYDLWFRVRASHEAVILLMSTPAVPYPSLQVVISRHNYTILIHQEKHTSGQQVLHEVETKGILDFWSWHGFTISVFGTTIQLFSHRSYGKEEIFSINHPSVATVRWFSIGSEATIAHWALFCTETAEDEVEAAVYPNCLSSLKDINYEGNQWVAHSEVPCIPWISGKIPKNYNIDDRFREGSALNALNKCRNPTNDREGPFCFTLLQSEKYVIEKRYCSIRRCRSSECRIAGTANDYIGTLSVTRSGRTCAPWVSDGTTITDGINVPTKTRIVNALRVMKANRENPEKINNPIIPRLGGFDRWNIAGATNRELTNVISEASGSEDASVERTSTRKRSDQLSQKEDSKFSNNTLYPELSAVNASNYCRNPSRSVAGTWCYTTDPEVPIDLCNVRDCEQPEECIYIISGDNKERRLYVLPEYRTEGLYFSVKNWEPDHPDSLTLVILSDDLQSSLIFKLSAVENEKVFLYYKRGDKAMELVKQKTLPHLLYLGRWTAFVIRMIRGGIKLYYEGAPNPLFEWEEPVIDKAFLPMYYYYNSEFGYSIGLAFKCDSKCHIEETKTDEFNKIIPISMWDLEETPSPDKLVLMLRGKGNVMIPLVTQPANHGYTVVVISTSNQSISFVKHNPPGVEYLHAQILDDPVLTTNSWTNITIRFHNYTIEVLRNDTEIFRYEHTSPLLFYFFSVSVELGGWAKWAPNCIPTDIDGEPQDGGWSEWGAWSCSATCGGGTGVRKRICNNPEPNIRGQPCLGPNTSRGSCNMNGCGEVSDETVALIKQRFRKQHTSIVAKEGSRVTVLADADIVSAVKSEIAKIKITWSLNGIYFKNERNRLKLTDNGVEISFAFVNDSGVYTQAIRREDESYLILKMITLAIIPLGREIIIRKTLPFSITCHCVVLGYVYSDLRVSWFLNGKIYKDYGISTPIAVNFDNIPQANVSHYGEWRCVVEQSDLNFKWTTNVVTVTVLGPPNWRTHLMEDKLTRPFFGWMPNETFVAVSAFFLAMLIVVIIVVSTILYFRLRKSLMAVDPQKKKLIGRKEPHDNSNAEQ